MKVMNYQITQLDCSVCVFIIMTWASLSCGLSNLAEPDSYEPTNKSDSKKGLFTHMKKKLPVFWKSRKTPTNYDDARLNFVSEGTVG